MSTRFQTYENTPEEAARIGWASFPEYCQGDPSRPYVLHDHVAGVFHYVSTPGEER